MTHRGWTSVAIPADLLDAIIEFKNLLIRRPHVKMELGTSAARATLAHNLDSQIPKVFAGLCHLGDALDLPGDLVDVVLGAKMLGVLTGKLTLVKLLLVEQGKGVMIASVSAEESCARRLGDEKTEQIEIKALARLEV